MKDLDITYGRQLDRRAFFSKAGKATAGIATLATAGTLLEACGGSTGGGSSSYPRNLNGIATSAPVRGGKLTVATMSEIDSFDPTNADWDTTGYLYGETVYDPLAAYTPDGIARPYLAQSITPSPDYSVWTIALRPNIVFHDNSPLDANVVYANLSAQLNSGLSAKSLTAVEKITIVDPLTVQLTMSSPWVVFPNYLTDQIGYIAALAVLRQSQSNSQGTVRPIGTGPFIYKEWVQNDHFTAIRNPHYWRPGLPYFDSIEFRPIVNPSSMQATLLSGGVDVITTTDHATIAALRANSDFITVDNEKSTVGQPDTNFIVLNLDQEPLNDLRVRQALAKSLDRQKVVDTVLSGIGELADGPFVKGSKFYAPSGYPELDLPGAKALIAQYKAQTGKGVSFTLGAPSGDSTYTDAITLVQGMWRAIGADVSITQTEQTTYLAHAVLGEYDADALQLFSCMDPDENYLWWTTQNVLPVGQVSLNMARNSDQLIQFLLDIGRQKTDDTERVQAYQGIAKQLAKDLPYMWINRSVAAVVARPWVTNFNATTFPDGSPGQGVSGGTFRFSTTWASPH